ncbi:MAG: hypothetical protein K2X29_08090 [Candidatus Obscuribacterales bacterium]|nr:hypothetical protein [Candidatus Obscuribacterales bacterium]
MEITDQGLFKRIALPDGWLVKDPDEAENFGSQMLEFYLPDDHSVSLSFYYQGRPAGSMLADALRSLLNKPPHQLSTDEADSIALILRNVADPDEFETVSMHTEDLNGRRILVADGNWKKISLKARHLFIDADGDGRIVQEIYFLAPKSKFDQYYPVVMDTFNSVEWSN